MDLTPIEVQEAANIIEDILDDNAEIIWGMTLDETFEDEVKVTIIATGFEQNINTTAQAASSMRGSSNRSEDFITRGISSTNNTTPSVQPTRDEMKLEDDIETPAFMRKKL
jgi:cell division protein FtsZ